MNAHFESIPGLGTLTTRGFTGSDLQDLRRHAHRPLHFELLLFGTADEVSADLLQVAHVAGGQSDANAVNLRGVRLLDASFGGGGLDCGGHFLHRKAADVIRRGVQIMRNAVHSVYRRINMLKINK